MMKKSISPPEGYGSWLDYAVQTMDTRTVEINQLFSDEISPTRQEMQEAAQVELQELRKMARLLSC
jgi:hypothetical protein